MDLKNFPLCHLPKNPKHDLEYVSEYFHGPIWDVYINNKQLYIHFELYLSARSLDPSDEVYYI